MDGVEIHLIVRAQVSGVSPWAVLVPVLVNLLMKV